MLRQAYLNTMHGLEAGLTVRDIAVYGLTVCWPDETVQTVLDRVAPYDFDNVPVRERAGGRDDGPVVGVLEDVKRYDVDAVVDDCMRRLQEPMLISASVSLVTFLPRIAERPYRLVLEGDRVMGVVTPSDVVQLPVRLLVFTLLLHLEETMRSLIRWKVGDEGAATAEPQPSSAVGPHPDAPTRERAESAPSRRDAVHRQSRAAFRLRPKPRSTVSASRICPGVEVK